VLLTLNGTQYGDCEYATLTARVEQDRDGCRATPEHERSLTDQEQKTERDEISLRLDGHKE
jgi:hypothetical protein